MPGPYHDFLLLSSKEHRFSDYMHFINDPRAISLEDDLIRYILNTLEWIPTLNPAKGNEPCKGLCCYGVTVIDGQSAPIAASIFEAWAELFSLGPETLSLTGGYIIDDGTGSRGGYEKLSFPRDETVDALRQIANHAKQVVKTKDEYFILHIGI